MDKLNLVEALRPGDEGEGFFLVKNAAVRTGSNGKMFLDLLLSDRSGEISGKKWDVVESELEGLKELRPGSLAKVRAQVVEWNGGRQLKIFRVRRAVKEDKLELSDYVKTAPEPPEEMLAYLRRQAEAIADADLRALCLRMLEEKEEKLLYYPAASRCHHAERAGLLYHTKRMLELGLSACAVYADLRKDWVVAGVILHDMEKTEEIEANELGMADSYSLEGQMLGHLVQGVKTVDRLGRELGVPEEKRVLLEHMILSHHYEPEFGSPRKPLFPEAELLHYLDILDARMYDMADALRGVAPGEFSEKVWVLDNRRLYRPTEACMPLPEGDEEA